MNNRLSALFILRIYLTVKETLSKIIIINDKNIYKENSSLGRTGRNENLVEN
jgi:hypothetical protein